MSDKQKEIEVLSRIVCTYYWAGKIVDEDTDMLNDDMYDAVIELTNELKNVKSASVLQKMSDEKFNEHIKNIRSKI